MALIAQLQNFKDTEVRCKCCGEMKTSSRLKVALQGFRYIYGSGIVVTNAYRCPKHNKEVGGVPNSSHTRGLAADIYPKDKNFSMDKFYQILIDSKLFTTIIYYPDRHFFHVDVRERGRNRDLSPVIKYWKAK